MTPNYVPLGILSGLTNILMGFVNTILDIIADALWAIIGWLLNGLGYLILNTPYPTKNGNEENPALWDGSEAVEPWKTVYEDLYMDMALPFSIVLLILAGLLSYFGKLVGELPFINTKPDLGRVFFIFIVVLSWWTIMTGALMFSDALTGMLAGGDTLSAAMDSDPTKNQMSGNYDGTSESSGNKDWATLLLLISLYFVSAGAAFGFLLFWMVRYLLVILFGGFMPVMLSLRAFKGTGVPVLGDVGEWFWDEWWFFVFATIPAGITIRMGKFVAGLSDALASNSAIGDVVTDILAFVASTGVPIVAAWVPIWYYRKESDIGDLAVEAGSMAASAGSTAASAASTYATTEEEGLSRIGEALDESDNDTLNRALRRGSYASDVASGMTGMGEVSEHDRYGRSTDEGDRSHVFNAANMFGSAAFDSVDRDRNAEAIAGEDYDEEDVKAMDIEGRSTRDVRQELKQRQEDEEEQEEYEEIVDKADATEMDDQRKAELYRKAMDPDGSGDLNDLADEFGIETLLDDEDLTRREAEELRNQFYDIEDGDLDTMEEVLEDSPIAGDTSRGVAKEFMERRLGQEEGETFQRLVEGDVSALEEIDIEAEGDESMGEVAKRYYDKNSDTDNDSDLEVYQTLTGSRLDDTIELGANHKQILDEAGVDNVDEVVEHVNDTKVSSAYAVQRELAEQGIDDDVAKKVRENVADSVGGGDVAGAIESAKQMEGDWEDIMVDEDVIETAQEEFIAQHDAIQQELGSEFAKTLRKDLDGIDIDENATEATEQVIEELTKVDFDGFGGWDDPGSAGSGGTPEPAPEEVIEESLTPATTPEAGEQLDVYGEDRETALRAKNPSTSMPATADPSSSPATTESVSDDGRGGRQDGSLETVYEGDGVSVVTEGDSSSSDTRDTSSDGETINTDDVVQTEDGPVHRERLAEERGIEGDTTRLPDTKDDDDDDNLPAKGTSWRS